MDRIVKIWYMKEYPTDNLGVTMNDNVTFADVLETLKKHEDVYELLGDEVDTVIRERVFEELADLMSVDYDFIYDMWLHG